MIAPSDVWPATVGGWVGLLTGVAALAGVIVTWNKTREARARQEERLEARVARVEERCTDQLNALGGRVTHDLNGVGRRIESLEEREASSASVTNGVLQSLAEIRAERRHLGESLHRIEQELSAMRKDMSRAFGPRGP